MNQRPAHEIARAIREGETTPSAVMQAHLDRIAAREAEVGAFQHLDAQAALERAGQADDQPPKGPLHGVPFAIKDIIDVAGMPVGWGCEAYAERQAEADATCVRLLRDAGAIPIGKTVTTEFAYFRPGKTANPHNLGHTPGGSSSGSAAAVADFMAPFALGSQTAASLIRPAAYCGVAAFRPTTGGYDLEGVMGLSPALDTLGVLARDPMDLRLLHEVLGGVALPPLPDFEDAPPRVALMRGPHWWDGDMEMRDSCTRALARLAATGAETGEVGHPELFAGLTQAHVTVMGYEAARARGHEYTDLRDRISDQFAALIAAGQKVSRAEYDAAIALRDRGYALLEHAMADFDALLVPSAPGPAPAGLAATGDPLFSRMWNLLQVPSLALPFGTTGAGLPMGVQLVAPKGRDARLLAVAVWAHGALQA